MDALESNTQSFIVKVWIEREPKEVAYATYLNRFVGVEHIVV